MKLYSLYDQKALIYTPPFVCENDEVAKRFCITNLMRSLPANSAPLQYPEQYTLFCLGSWDMVEGVITSEKIAVAGLLEIVSAYANISEQYAQFFKNLYDEFTKKKDEKNEKVSD